METILCLLHTDADGTPGKLGREALSAARTLAEQLAAPLAVGLVGGDVQAAAEALAGCGAARFLGVAGAELAEPRYGSDAAAAEAVCRASGSSLIVAPATSRWLRALPGVALRLDGRVDTHASGIAVADGAPRVGRWLYRQRMEATLTRSQRPWMVLLDPGAAPPYQGEPARISVDAVPFSLPADCARTAALGVQAPPADAQTIRPDAGLLLVAGAGWTKTQADGAVHAQEAQELILDFLARTQASLGSSKSLVDLSGEGQAVLTFLTHMHQVGQTGSTPRHPKGLATCCHGEEPHVVGWRFIQERRAVNLDPGCGWARGKADVLYVADAFKVMARVNEMLRNA
ncbi:MAG: electron transfer flavoprotein subunit alpha/FixB family protein [Candidatus Methylomirabilales bacterium]